MAISVGCTDFNEQCEFRVTTNDGDDQTLVDLATPHALQYHNEPGLTEIQMRELVSSQIKSLMQQAHTADMFEPSAVS
jgi:predicted small metal-binding protein